ncbi:palmitoyl-protein thioesterase 1 [Condylostylus longicornis]|uniref:palmitoyl-protein thioesterase 1 n=1 Tax=Condylostylus longicornis TaxID=2530218 RepID=UPI00244E19B2|nr:palmitoyl-protein thioesterase 1 [Condylostylus longicornis]
MIFKYNQIIFAIISLILSNGFCEIIEKTSESPVPVVIWHGMGDTCCNPLSMGRIKQLIENNIPGVYVKSLEIGGNIVNDLRSGFFIHPDKQLADVCEQLNADENLQNGFHAIGFSQGAQFLRGIAQKCIGPQMKTLISVGGQHQGVYGLPNCPSLSSKTCDTIRKLLSKTAYAKWVQKLLVQATYWHDPLKEDEYKAGSTFIGEINNENLLNSTYALNLQRLEKFVLVKFMNDSMVEPKESSWFEFYTPGQSQHIQPLKESPLYKEDRLGLKRMDEEGKLVFLEVEGDHLRFKDTWFVENIIPYWKKD